MKKILGLPVSRKISTGQLGFGAGTTPAGSCLLSTDSEGRNIFTAILVATFRFHQSFLSQVLT